MIVFIIYSTLPVTLSDLFHLLSVSLFCVCLHVCVWVHVCVYACMKQDISFSKHGNVLLCTKNWFCKNTVKGESTIRRRHTPSPSQHTRLMTVVLHAKHTQTEPQSQNEQLTQHADLIFGLLLRPPEGTEL